jgi:hypothetical protein
MEKLRDLLHQHDDKVDQGLEKAGEMAKSKSPGHDQQIDQAVDKLQHMTGEGDTTEPKPGTPPQGAAPAETAPTDQAGGFEKSQEVPGGPQPDVPAGPGHEPPPQR